MNLQAQASNEPGTPFIRNYKPDEYDAHYQNWVILQDHRRVMYFGNSDGVLVFDGKYWELIPMPNNTAVRSLALDKHGTIYVGAMGEFGYLAFDHTGKLTYISLSKQLPEKVKDFKNVWSTHATPHGIYFETQEKIFHFYKGQIDVYSLSISGSPGSHKINDVVIVRKRGKNGLHIFRDGQLQILPYTENLPWESAGRYVLLPYVDNQILIVTQNLGMYIYDLDILLDNGSFISDFSQKNIPPTVLKKFPTEIDEFLQYNELYHAVKVNNNCYAFGTRKGGIVMMDQKGKPIQVINKNRGLQNDNVHGLYVDQDQNLWAALNIGNSYIEISSPITQFNERNGIDDVVISITRHKGILYMAAHNGCFYLPEYKLSVKNDGYGFLPVKNASSDFWDFISVKNTLFAAGRSDLYQIDGKTAKKIKMDKFIYCFGRSKRFPDHIFLGMREGLAALQLMPSSKKDRESNDFLQVKYIDHGGFKQIKNIIRKITSDSHGNLWLTTSYSGIIYIRFNSQDISDFQIYRYNKNHGLPREDFNTVYFINNRLIVASQRGIFEGVLPDDFEANPTGVKFVPDEIFGKRLPDRSTLIDQIYVDKKQNIWIRSGIGLGRFIKNQEDNYTWNKIPFNKVGEVSNYFYGDPNGILWCPSEDTIYRIDLNQRKEYKSIYYTLIRRVLVYGKKAIFNGNYYDPKKKSGEYYVASLLVQPDQLIKILDYKDNSITFEYSTTFYEHARANRFQYMLEGFDKDWSSWSAETKKEYTNLNEGIYCFKVKAKNIFETESSEAFYKFVILPPWYRSTLAYLGYGLVTILILLIISAYIVHQYNARLRILREKKRYELPPDLVGEHIKKLLDSLKKEKHYLNPNLTVGILSDILAIPTYQLSYIINKKLNINFCDLINKYRVDEAKRHFSDSGKGKTKILDIAFDVGFNSKSAFNTAFKKFTNMTPSEFKKIILSQRERTPKNHLI